MLDSASGYYYNQTNGLHYDSDSGFKYSESIGMQQLKFFSFPFGFNCIQFISSCVITLIMKKVVG